MTTDNTTQDLAAGCERERAEIGLSAARFLGRLSDSPFYAVFSAWRRLERERGGEGALAVAFDPAQGGQKEDAVAQGQRDLLNAAALLDAHTVADLVLKLALWRWSHRDIDPEGPKTAQDCLAYAVFKDLVHLSGAQELATPQDVATDYYREQRPLLSRQ